MIDGDDAGDKAERGRVFELAAELFGILATPMRLRILSALCDREKSVTELLSEIDTTQPNLSQHLNLLYRSGVLAKRKEGTQVIYRVQSEQAVMLCRSVCTQIAIEMEDGGGSIPNGQRLTPRPSL
ncbi:MAG: metalloregulator ArsR/SmtB family transcription factor [Serpentinimonas sp.]|nr:metalloregulator ArsR/SmtB family transcription factor [Serpentinimonas sp.]